MDRRGFMDFVAGGAVGVMVGYYVGVKELLGIQSTGSGTGGGSPSPASPTDVPTTDPGRNGGDPSEGLLSVPFTERFDGGLNGWTVDRRYRTGEDRAPENPPAGEGGFSEKYGGSVRLHVSGGPSTIGVARELTGLRNGDTVSVTYHVEASGSQPGKVGVPVFAPDGDDMADAWVARNEGDVDPGEHTITGTVPEDFPEGTELRVTADVWPGEFTAYVTEVRAERGSTADRFSFERASPGAPVPAGEWYVMADDGPHRISGERASHGRQSIYQRGASGLGETRIAIDLDFSPIGAVRFDGYPVRNATGAGDIKVHVDDTDFTIGGITQAETGRWHRDLGGDVSQFSGTHTLILRTRGDGNEAFFDNVRLLDGNGSLIAPSAVT